MKEGRDCSLPPQALQPGPFNLKSHTGGGMGAARLARRQEVSQMKTQGSCTRGSSRRKVHSVIFQTAG